MSDKELKEYEELLDRRSRFITNAKVVYGGAIGAMATLITTIFFAGVKFQEFTETLKSVSSLGARVVKLEEGQNNLDKRVSIIEDRFGKRPSANAEN